ncbi:MAG: glycosyltransferase, partial [Dehalococcoidales bacterium]|nr:glycosyltransferase [Dehalococcoidales bacterium]
PPRDANKLAEAILKLGTDEKLRQQMGARGKPKATQYDWSLVAKRVLDFYTETLDRVKQPEAIPEAAILQVSAASGKH